MNWREVFEEPFRVLFPIAVLAGIAGVALWPLMLTGVIESYPGVWHVRIMIEGFFGGFMLGFLGTSLPKLLEVRPWNGWETGAVALFQLASAVAHVTGNTLVGDLLFGAAVAVLLLSLAVRFPQRRDLPPPGFILVGLGWICAAAGLAVDYGCSGDEWDDRWRLLARLWLGHGFVLLGILGAGGFLLPRFLGLGIRERFESAPVPTRAWIRSALIAGAVGISLIGSYALEAFGFSRSMGAFRSVLMIAYLSRVMPLERLRWSGLGIQPYLILGLVSIPVGIVASGFLPGWRIAFSHLELVAGFAFITLGVATRVISGHSGRRQRLERIHAWLCFAAVLMGVGMASRMSGDFIPRLQKSHFIYGALTWIAGLIVWAVVVLPSVSCPDEEEVAPSRPARQ